MNTLIIATVLAFINDPTGGSTTTTTTTTTTLTCEEELQVCEDDQQNSYDVLEAAILWAESLRDYRDTGGGTTGGAAYQPTIGDIVDACRLFGAPNLGECVDKACSNLPGNCL